MRSRIDAGESDLLEYQRKLVERLVPTLDRVDDDRVTSGSGLTTRKAGKNWAVELMVEGHDSRVPALRLLAAADQCILSFAGSEVIECHRDPGSAENLVDAVASLTERYLSGVTVLEYFNRRGRVVRTDYFYGLDSDADPACKIGTSKALFAFLGKPRRTVRHTYRFLRDEGAADQRVAADGRAPVKAGAPARS